MKQMICTCIAALALITGCKKSEDAAPLPGNFGTVGNSGSSWTYVSSSSGVYTLTMTDKDTLINAKSYDVLKNSAGGNEYQGKFGNDYYRFLRLPTFAVNGFEELYLKADAGVGGSWQINLPISFGGFPGTAQLTYTLTEAGISKTVLNKTFPNVIHVKLTVKAGITGFMADAGGGDFYYADGVGIISYAIDLKDPNTNTSSFTENIQLQSYTIK